MEQDDGTYRILRLASGKDAIFAPNDICAIAVIDSYFLSKDKAVEMLRIANSHDDLVEMLEALIECEWNQPADLEGCQREARELLAGIKEEKKP